MARCRSLFGASRWQRDAGWEANYKLFKKSSAVTDFHEFPDRTHWTIGQPGWEKVADYALDWALKSAR